MTERLQKFLARAGVASRRRAEELIAEGRVSVNNQAITEPGSKVQAGRDLVTVDGKLVEVTAKRTYFLFYKPPGVVTTLSDPQGRPTIADYTREIGERLFPVGRLDYDAEGALLLTNDGDLAQRLMHPKHQVPRTYLAKVRGMPREDSLEKLRQGVRLEDGEAKPTSVEVFEVAEQNTWLKVVVTEGRNHLVKRLFAAIGHPVLRLYRPTFAGVPVHGVRPGEMRPLTATELERITGPEVVIEETTLRLPPRRHGHGPPEPPQASGRGDGRTRAPRRSSTPSFSADGEANTSRRPSTDRRPPRGGGKSFGARPTGRFGAGSGRTVGGGEARWAPTGASEEGISSRTGPRDGAARPGGSRPFAPRGAKTFDRPGKPAFGRTGRPPPRGEASERTGFAARSGPPSRGGPRGKPAFGRTGRPPPRGEASERTGFAGRSGPPSRGGPRGKPAFGRSGPSSRGTGGPRAGADGSASFRAAPRSASGAGGGRARPSGGRPGFARSGPPKGGAGGRPGPRRGPPSGGAGKARGPKGPRR